MVFSNWTKGRSILKKKTIFLFIGRTNSGKSTIVKQICDEMKLKAVKSYTTRPMRESEKTYSDHIFIHDEDVEQYRNDMAAYTEINGYKYFTTYDILDNSDVYIIDPNGVKTLKEKCSNRYNFVEIYIRTPCKIAEQRARLRGDDIKIFKSRWVDENDQFTNYENQHSFHYHLRNDRPLKESISKVEKWIQYEIEKDGDADES